MKRRANTFVDYGSPESLPTGDFNPPHEALRLHCAFLGATMVYNMLQVRTLAGNCEESLRKTGAYSFSVAEKEMHLHFHWPTSNSDGVVSYNTKEIVLNHRLIDERDAVRAAEDIVDKTWRWLAQDSVALERNGQIGNLEEMMRSLSVR